MPATMAVKAVLAAAVSSAAAFAFWPDRPAPFDEVAIARADGRVLHVARDEITWQTWRACYDAGGCTYLPKAGRKDGGDPFPVVDINWDDANEFIRWLNAGTRKAYRLPTLEEWQAIAVQLPKPQVVKRFTDPRLAWAADYAMSKPKSRKVMPSGSFTTLANGVRDLDGNVWEWTSTCAVEGSDSSSCPAFVAAGEHEAELPWLIRDPVAGGCATGVPPSHVGLRVVRDG